MAALEQTLISTKNTLFYNSIKSAFTTSQPRFFSLSTKQSKNRLFFSSRIRCSYEYFTNSNNSSINNGGISSNSGPYEGYGPPKYPRPIEIQWKKELCNSVQLIGIVGTPVQIKHLASGKVLAWSRLAVKRSQNETLWINLTFWDELAHVASQHVEKGKQIYVVGRLVSDTVENGEGKEQTFYKVVVQQLNFVERGFSAPAVNDGDSNFAAPGRKQNNFSGNQTGSVEELWQAYFANPGEWWDNRKNKRSPNYPDFKHKDTGEALWVEGRTNPPWVKSQLAILDSKMESFHDHNAGSPVNFMSFDNFPLY